MALELAKICHEPLFCCFSDFQKEYNTILGTKLFEVLVHELEIDPNMVKCINSMYSNICTVVCVVGYYMCAFGMHNGVRQRCLASPLVFYLFMD